MITDSDLVNYQKFQNAINEGKFEIKGSATIPVALLFKWYAELGPKLNGAKKEIESLNQRIEVLLTDKEPEVKPIKKKVKK